MKSMTLAARQEILALGWMADGSPIFPISGADPGENGEEGGTGETGAGGEAGTGAVDPAAGAAGVESAGDPAALAQQLEVLTRRLLAADKSKGEAERRLREIDDAGKGELQKAQDTVKELTTKLEAATQAATRARLEREILKHPGYIWHDPEVVLALVDMDGIDIDEETGRVTGVNDALKKLAASKPFLLKGKNQDGGGNGNNGGKPAGASGTNPTGGSSNNAEKRRDELKAKYKL